MSEHRLHGPAYVSFSGGRTSAMMLWLAIQAGLGEGVYVLFANTGKEREETLAFVEECSQRWGVPVVWLERAPGGGFSRVDFRSASRKGEPFEALIAERGYVPHPGAPYCSTELKARVCRDYMRSLGHDEWDAAVGMRADEQRRVAKLRGRKIEGGHVVMPLADAGICLGDVDVFWATQPFGLQLHAHEGNCDLCFKKSAPKIAGLVDRVPSRGDWWAEQERATGTRWRNDRPTYAAIAAAARDQVRLPLFDDGGEPCEVCA